MDTNEIVINDQLMAIGAADAELKSYHMSRLSDDNSLFSAARRGLEEAQTKALARIVTDQRHRLIESIDFIRSLAKKGDSIAINMLIGKGSNIFGDHPDGKVHDPELLTFISSFQDDEVDVFHICDVVDCSKGFPVQSFEYALENDLPQVAEYIVHKVVEDQSESNFKHKLLGSRECEKTEDILPKVKRELQRRTAEIILVVENVYQLANVELMSYPVVAAAEPASSFSSRPLGVVEHADGQRYRNMTRDVPSFI